jgi:hypothetical protein
LKQTEINPDEIKALITDLGNKDAVIRLNASRALLRKREAAVGPLAEALHNPDERTHLEAGKILDEIDVDWSKFRDVPTISALVGALGIPDGLVRVTARQVLVMIGKVAVAPLTQALTSKDNRQRWEAAKALGQIGDPGSTDALITALEDDMFDVRWLASEALMAIGHKAIVPLLGALAKKPESLWLREGAHHFFHGIDMSTIRNVLMPVRQALEDVDSPLKLPFAVDEALKALTGNSPSAP